jgi:hypothetical protein
MYILLIVRFFNFYMAFLKQRKKIIMGYDRYRVQFQYALVRVLHISLLIWTREPRNSSRHPGSGVLWLSNLDLRAKRLHHPGLLVPLPREAAKASDRLLIARRAVLHWSSSTPLRSTATPRACFFIVACSTATLKEFDDFAPSKAMNDTFVPKYDSVGPDAPLVLLLTASCCSNK